MGAREYNYTRGNTALVPERKPQYDKNKNSQSNEGSDCSMNKLFNSQKDKHCRIKECNDT